MSNLHVLPPLTKCHRSPLQKRVHSLQNQLLGLASTLMRKRSSLSSSSSKPKRQEALFYDPVLTILLLRYWKLKALESCMLQKQAYNFLASLSTLHYFSLLHCTVQCIIVPHQQKVQQATYEGQRRRSCEYYYFSKKQSEGCGKKIKAGFREEWKRVCSK